ncbi:hypothetical protein FKM82_004938, partial [Ascaphus truei]
MDNYPVPLHPQDCMLPHCCVTLYQCGYPSSEGYSSLSPASSTDSCGLSPPYIPYITSQQIYGNIPATHAHTATLRTEHTGSAEPKNKRGRGKLAYSQRQSASEREKLRMRNLSNALQNLRRYLPPSVAPAGKNLTKIETLQLTIRYISNLSTQLGFSEEVLAHRRQSAIQRANSYPHGPSCMDCTHTLCSVSPGETFKQTVASTRPFTDTRPVEPGSQNMEGGSQLPYELP